MTPELIKQKKWSDEELTASGFRKYSRKKRLIMARQVSDADAPVIIESPMETLHIGADYMLCYDPSPERRSALADYNCWPVRIDIFDLTYRQWDEPQWLPTPAQQHLLEAGCLPYFKADQVWAKKLINPAYVQSVESPTPVLVEPEMWVLIGTLGEPWYFDEATFYERYSELESGI